LKNIIKPEVLAPVGDKERLISAVTFGADAVYLGGKMFGMRAAPQNFNHEELKQAVEYAHSNNVKVYLTCNTLPTNDEIGELPEFLRYCSKIGVDAIIVADIGILMLAKRIIPEMEIHISTQAGIVNYLTANELYSLGAKRVVLARELSLDEIKTIRSKTPPELDIEAFVHGAMCMSFSGRCLLSNYLVGRDANRGECAQPCRWGYHLVEEKRPNEYYPIYEDEKGSYILNAKDLSMIEHIDKLIDAGITSFKIEGRAKSAYYVAVITNAYRNAVDLYLRNPESYKLPEWILEETKKVSHRQYSTGFYFGRPENGQYYENGGYVRSWDVVAVVDGYEDGHIVCIEKNKFSVGETAEVLEPKSPPVVIKIENIINSANESVQSACHPMEVLRIPSSQAFAKGSIIRIAR